MKSYTEVEQFYQRAIVDKNNRKMLSAFKNFQYAANKGHAKAQCALAEMYMKGEGTPVDLEKAFIYYEKASNQDNAQADFALANLYYQGKVVPENLDKYAELLHKSANAQYVPAQYAIGVILYAKDEKKLGLEYLKHAANQGHIPAWRSAGIVCFEDEDQQDYTLARTYLEKLELKDQETTDQCILGIIYFKGLGVTVDKKKSMDYFRAAILLCKSRTENTYLTMAQVYMGIGFLDNDCLIKDPETAHGYFISAISRLTIGSPEIKKVISIIKDGIQLLDFSDLLSLYHEHLDLTNLPNKTLVYPQHFKLLHDIYADALRLCAKQLDPAHEAQFLMKQLPDLDDYPPEKAYALALQELSKNDKDFRANYLRDYLIITCAQQNFAEIYVESLYYFGIYLIFLNDPRAPQKGLDFIFSSAKKGYIPAINYIKFHNMPKKDKSRINLLIQAGKNAEGEKLHQIARLYYKKALDLNRSNENLLRCAVHEILMNNRAVATSYFSELLKKAPEPEALYLALGFFSYTDLARAVALLDNEDKLYNRIIKEGKKDTWQEKLYCARELHIAERLFDKNKMQQGVKHLEQAALRSYTPAILGLALCYIEGWGVKRDGAKAVDCLHSIQSDPYALYYRGILSKYWVILNKAEGQTNIDENVQNVFKKYPDVELMKEYLAHSVSAKGLIYIGNKACEIQCFRIATMHYLQALQLEPKNPQALFAIALCHMRWEEYQTALQYINNALHYDKTFEHAKIAQEVCHLKLGIVTLQPESVVLKEEEPVSETESYQAIKISRKVRKKRAQQTESKNIALYKDNIFACTTVDQFMEVFYKIKASNLHTSLHESLKTWVDEHTECKHPILLILQEQGDLYAQYIEEWRLNAVENTVIEPIKPPIVKPVIQPAVEIPQIPVVKKVSTESRPNLKQKRQIKDTNAKNQKIIEMRERLDFIPQYRGLLSRLHWCLNQQITNNCFYGLDIIKFEQYKEQFQDTRLYQILCDVYAFFTLEQANMHQYPVKLHTHFTDIGIIMRDVHRDIELLKEQCFQLCTKSFPEIQSHLKTIKQLHGAFNDFSQIRMDMNLELKQNKSQKIFAPVPLVVGELFTLFASLCKKAVLTGSGSRKIYEQAKHIYDTDLDYVLCDANIEKLKKLKCERIPYLKDMEVYRFKYWYSRSNFVWVDMLCIANAENALLDDMRGRNLTNVLFYDALGNFNDLSGLAFHHLDNNIIDIPGNSIERAHKEPRLLLHVVAEELRMIKQFKIPHISENVMIAFKTLTRNPESPDQTGRIHAFTRKCIKKYGAVDLSKKLVEHGLLPILFDIKHEGDWKETAALLEKKVAKVFLPVQVEAKQDSVLVLSSMFLPKKEDEVLDEKGVELGVECFK